MRATLGGLFEFWRSCDGGRCVDEEVLFAFVVIGKAAAAEGRRELQAGQGGGGAMRGGSSALGLTGSILEVAHGDGETFLAEGGGRAIAIGVVLAILSALANGSFAVLSKTRSMRRAHVSPLIFNFWAWLVLPLYSYLSVPRNLRV